MADPRDVGIEQEVILVCVAVLVAAYSVRVRRAQRCAEIARQTAQSTARVFSESFHASPIPLSLTSLVTHRITEINNAYIQMIGWTRAELIGRSASELGIYPTKARAMMARRLIRSGLLRNYTTTMTCKDGQTREVVLSKDLISIDNELHSLATIVDQTAEKRAVAALRSSDERMRELAENLDQVFWISSADRTEMHYVSPAYEKIWGRTCESVYAEPMSHLEAVLPIDRARLEAEGERPNREYRIARPDGSIRWIRTKTFPIRDQHGTVTKIAGVATDVTEQRSLEEQLHQAQKMESLGMLAGGIAHDFNNLLAVISSCSGLLGEAIDKTSPDHELVDDIADAVVRASSLTRQLLAFSRKQVIEPIVLDPNLVVNDTRKLLRRLVGVNVEVMTSLAPDLGPVRIDRGQLVQVLLNLAVNARDAMPCGTLKLTTRNHESQVVLEVTDTGTGMAPEVAARACDPFFTTKEQGKGTGMGLAVVHGIVDQAGGRIEIDTAVGVGTTFRVYLPAAAGRVEAIGKLTECAMRGVERVLVVDDDDNVRRATARALRTRGYTVVEASSGRAALIELATANADLLLTDLVMPGMNGRVLAEAAQSRFPQLKLLLMTGYTDDEAVHRGVERGEVDLIEKPFTIQTLAAKVREVLDREVVISTAVPRLAAVG